MSFTPVISVLVFLSAAVLTVPSLSPPHATQQLVVESDADASIPDVSIANGMHVSATVIVREVLNRGNGTSVRPVAVNVEFMYGRGVSTKLNRLELVDPASATPITSTLVGISPVVLDSALPDDLPPHNYNVGIAPKGDLHWSDVRGEGDIRLDVIEAH